MTLGSAFHDFHFWRVLKDAILAKLAILAPQMDPILDPILEPFRPHLDPSWDTPYTQYTPI